jgi:type I restriction enzyme S subunit
LKVPFPSLEQQKIANFLDHETAKIDTLIAKQQELIKLLKEKRQAVISHAVTKGLNPNAPMRDSGVEWLGEVPAHWRVKRLKHLVVNPLMYGANEAAIDELSVHVLYGLLIFKTMEFASDHFALAERWPHLICSSR